MKVYDYNTRPGNILKVAALGAHGKPVPLAARTLWYGLELEFEYKCGKMTKRDPYYGYTTTDYSVPESKLDALPLTDYAIFKYDGSLEYGVEICTLPAQPQTHLEKIAEFYKLAMSQFKVLPSCGMHVHVSRKALNRMAIASIVGLVNNPVNKAKIVAIAGREEPEYASIEKKYRYEVLNAVRGRKNPDERWYPQHHDAINISGRQTIEFRLFRTPKNFEEFETRFLFVVACSEWAKKRKWMTSKWERFAEFVRGHERFAKLEAWL